MKKVTPEQSNNTYDKKDGKWQIDKINDDGDFINALSCLFARRAVRRFAWQNGAVSSTPAEAGENRLFSRRAGGDSLGEQDSEGEAGGVSAANVAWDLPQLSSSLG